MSAVFARCFSKADSAILGGLVDLAVWVVYV